MRFTEYNRMSTVHDPVTAPALSGMLLTEHIANGNNSLRCPRLIYGTCPSHCPSTVLRITVATRPTVRLDLENINVYRLLPTHSSQDAMGETITAKENERKTERLAIKDELCNSPSAIRALLVSSCTN